MVINMNRKTLSAKNIAFCALFTALITVGAYLKIPVPVMPFTMQSTFVILSGLMLGGKLGSASCIAYMLLGLAGAPVFTQGGGIGYVFKPTFGYIIGYCLAAYITGYIAYKKKYAPSLKRLIAASCAGLGALYFVGVIYLYLVKNVFSESPVAFGTLFVYGFLITIPGDLILSVLGAILVKKLPANVNLAYRYRREE